MVCFTQGILRALPPRELDGVIAHELAHIKHRHMLVGTVAATMAGAIAMIASIARWGFIFGGGRDDGDNPLGMLVMAIVAPLAAVIIQMAISRRNEFQADRTGGEITGDPMGLAGALKRLESGARRIPMDVNPAGASLAIVNPFAGRRRGLTSLFHHPSPHRGACRRPQSPGDRETVGDPVQPFPALWSAVRSRRRPRRLSPAAPERGRRSGARRRTGSRRRRAGRRRRRSRAHLGTRERTSSSNAASRFRRRNRRRDV